MASPPKPPAPGPSVSINVPPADAGAGDNSPPRPGLSRMQTMPSLGGGALKQPTPRTPSTLPGKLERQVASGKMNIIASPIRSTYLIHSTRKATSSSELLSSRGAGSSSGSALAEPETPSGWTARRADAPLHSGLPEVWPPASWADQRRHALGGYSVERRVEEMLRAQGIEYYAASRPMTAEPTGVRQPTPAAAPAAAPAVAPQKDALPTGWARQGMPPREKKKGKEKAAAEEEAERAFNAREEWQEAPEKIRLHKEAEARDLARRDHTRARTQAHAAWREHDYASARLGLDTMLRVNSDCEVLHRWRSRLHSREGRFRESVEDASRAVQLNPRGAYNLKAQGASLEAARELTGAAQAYMHAMRLGLDGGSKEIGLTRLLDTVQRERDGHTAEGFHDPTQPAHLKVGEGHLLAPCSSVGHVRCNIFDPRKLLEGGSSKGSGPKEPGPPLLHLDAVSAASVGVVWEPGDDGGDEIYHYLLELQTFSTKWRPATEDFFDDWLPWKLAHQGPAKVRAKTLGGLKPNTPLRLRLRCKNSMGDSPWSETLEVTTVVAGGRGATTEHEVPRSWMQADLQDVARKYLAEFAGSTPAQFMDEVREALRPYVFELRRVYKLYEQLGAGPGGGVGSGISQMEFGRFVKDAGLMQPGRGKGKSWQYAKGAAALPSGEVDLIFARSNVKAAASGRRAAKEALSFMEGAQEHLLQTTAGAEEGDAATQLEKQIDLMSGASEMSIQEWIGGLIRLAWACFGRGREGGAPKLGLGARLTSLIQEAVLPGAHDHLNRADPMEEHLANRRVRAVLAHYAPELREIFGSYAQADQNSAGSLTSLDTLNLNETLFMLKEGAMMDDKLTLLQVTNIFAAVNAGAEEEEDGDDDEAELCFDEFAVLLARVCDAKVPPDARKGDEFERVLQRWLHNAVIPEYKMILALKKRGIGSKTL